MICRWCKAPLPRKQSRLALIMFAPMAHLDPADCAQSLSEPVPEEDRDWVEQPPEDIDTCGACKGAGEVLVGREWTGAPMTEVCTWCRGTGRPFPWNVLTT